MRNRYCDNWDQHTAAYIIYRETCKNQLKPVASPDSIRDVAKAWQWKMYKIWYRYAAAFFLLHCSCTSSIPEECHQQASSYHILPPVISAKLITRNYFEFRYGVIEVRAKFPEGDWLYPGTRISVIFKVFPWHLKNPDEFFSRVNYVFTLLKNMYFI